MGTRVVEQAATMPIVLWLIQFDSEHEGELPMRTAIAITSSSYELTAARNSALLLPFEHSLLRPVPFRCKTLNCYPLAHQLAEHPNLWLPGNCICLATFLSFSCVCCQMFFFTYLSFVGEGRQWVPLPFTLARVLALGSKGRRKYIFALLRLYSRHLLGIFHRRLVFESMAS